MKKICLATVAVLSTTLLAGGVQAFAQSSLETTTDNVVGFTSDGSDLTVVQPPVVHPEVETIEPTPPGQTGPFTIAYAPQTFDFGQNAISTSDRWYSIVADERNLADQSGTTPYVSFAQVQDTRGTHAGWTLNVSLTDFTSESGDVLTGAKIKLANPEIVFNKGEGDRDLQPSAVINNEEQNALILDVNDQDIPVMRASVGQGAGASSIYWGDQEKLTEQNLNKQEGEIIRNDDIQLFVPGSTTQLATNYTAEMTWTLTASVDSSGETVNP